MKCSISIISFWFFSILHLFFRFHGFCVSILLISIIVTIYRKVLSEKKKTNQVQVGNQRPSSVASTEVPRLNVVSSNDPMISLRTVFIFSSISLTFLILLVFYTGGTHITLWYFLIICFYVSFSITPPLYFFNRIGKLKIAIAIVFEMFN